jgi:hypothetical protein
MAHRYRDVILVRIAGQADAAPAPPAAFKWREIWYQVDAVLATWRLRDRWWAAPAADVVGRSDSAADALAPTERVYYRVRCVDPEGEQVFDLYHDAASGLWRLDRVHD